MKYIRLSHCVYHCDYHIVIVTKYRRKVFNQGVFAYMSKRLEELKLYYPQIKIKEINHDVDHIHMLVSIPPTMRVGKLVGIIKQNTSREVKQKFPFVQAIYRGRENFWSDGYFVATVGINELVIKKYIEEQGKLDSGQTAFEAG